MERLRHIKPDLWQKVIVKNKVLIMRKHFHQRLYSSPSKYFYKLQHIMIMKYDKWVLGQRSLMAILKRTSI